jgi:AmiR/NasT family two-component response regulator
MDGSEASERILRDHSIPIIFLTSHMEPEIIEKSERITSYGYVIKNLNPTILMVSIRMAFRLFEAKQELQRQKNEIHDLYNNAPCGYHTWLLTRPSSA